MANLPSDFDVATPTGSSSPRGIDDEFQKIKQYTQNGFNNHENDITTLQTTIEGLTSDVNLPSGIFEAGESISANDFVKVVGDQVYKNSSNPVTEFSFLNKEISSSTTTTNIHAINLDNGVLNSFEVGNVITLSVDGVDGSNTVELSDVPVTITGRNHHSVRIDGDTAVFAYQDIDSDVRITIVKTVDDEPQVSSASVLVSEISNNPFVMYDSVNAILGVLFTNTLSNRDSDPELESDSRLTLRYYDYNSTDGISTAISYADDSDRRLVDSESDYIINQDIFITSTEFTASITDVIFNPDKERFIGLINDSINTDVLVTNPQNRDFNVAQDVFAFRSTKAVYDPDREDIVVIGQTSIGVFADTLVINDSDIATSPSTQITATNIAGSVAYDVAYDTVNNRPVIAYSHGDDDTIIHGAALEIDQDNDTATITALFNIHDFATDSESIGVPTEIALSFNETHEAFFLNGLFGSDAYVFAFRPETTSGFLGRAVSDIGAGATGQVYTHNAIIDGFSGLFNTRQYYINQNDTTLTTDTTDGSISLTFAGLAVGSTHLQIRTTGETETTIIPSNAAPTVWIFRPSAGTTILTGTDEGGQLLANINERYNFVYRDGRNLIQNTNYTVSETSITLNTASIEGNEFKVVSVSPSTVTDNVSAAEGGTFSENVNFTGGSTYNGQTFDIDSEGLIQVNDEEFKAAPELQTAQTGTTAMFEDIPAGVSRIDIMFNNVIVTSATDNTQLMVRVNELSSANDYYSTDVRLTGTDSNVSAGIFGGFNIFTHGGTHPVYGFMTLLLIDPSTNTWVQSHSTSQGGSNNGANVGGGRIVLGANTPLVRIDVVANSGSSLASTSQFNISYQ